MCYIRLRVNFEVAFFKFSNFEMAINEISHINIENSVNSFLNFTINFTFFHKFKYL
jgi:hypothetical protein